MTDTAYIHAEEAVRWAMKPYPAEPEKTNWQVWIRLMKREALKPYKRTIMRNQVTLGMNNNYYPTLSRFALMHDPALFGSVINPRKIRALDCPFGRLTLCVLYQKVTGENPRITDWRNAKRLAS